MTLGRLRADRATAIGPALGYALVFAFTLGYTPNLFTRPVPNFLVWEDWNFYYPIFRQLTLGRRIYVDLYEPKDPLYFYSFGASYAGLGTAGVAALETLIVLGIVALLILILRELKLTHLQTFIVAFVFVVLFFSPRAYYVFPETLNLPVFIIFASCWLGLRRHAFLAGLGVAALLFARFTHALFVPVVVWTVLRGIAGERERLSQPMKFVAGAVVGALFGVAVIGARGEFQAWLDVLTFVFTRYKSLHAPEFDLAELLTLVDSRRVVALVAATAAFAVIGGAIWLVRIARENKFVAKLFSDDGHALTFTGLMAASAAIHVVALRTWAHHMMMFGMVAAFVLAASFIAVRLLNARAALAPLVCAAGVATVMLTGAYLHDKGQLELMSPSLEFLRVPRELADEPLQACIADLGLDRAPLSFASLGGADVLPVPAVTPPNMRPACSRFIQQVNGDMREIEATLPACIATNAEVVFQRDNAEASAQLNLTVKQVLDENFTLAATCPGMAPTRVYVRASP